MDLAATVVARALDEDFKHETSMSPEATGRGLTRGRVDRTLRLLLILRDMEIRPEGENAQFGG